MEVKEERRGSAGSRDREKEGEADRVREEEGEESGKREDEWKETEKGVRSRGQRGAEGRAEGQVFGGPREAPCRHLQNENGAFLGKICSAFKSSLLEWPRTFGKSFLCSSSKAP